MYIGENQSEKIDVETHSLQFIWPHLNNRLKCSRSGRFRTRSADIEKTPVRFYSGKNQ